MNNKIVLFENAFEEYKVFAEKRHKKQGYETLLRNFNLHILPYFEGRNICELKKLDIIDWQNKIIDENFCNSFNSSLYYNFSSFIKFCIDSDYLENNIVLEVGNFKKKIEVKEYDYYNLFEFMKFIRKLDNYVIKQFFKFMFFCGTRPCEAMALRFCDITGKYAHTVHNIERRGDRQLTTPKNQWSVRYIKLPLLIRFSIFKLKSYYIKHNGSCPDEYYIFGGPKPLSTSTIDRYKAKACEKANIRPITQHQFRHSYATRMIHKGIPIDEVSKSIGHSKVSMTVDVYLHPKKRVPSTPHTRLKIFETPLRNFKNLSQSIITFFM